MKRINLILFFTLFGFVLACNSKQQEKKMNKEVKEDTKKEINGFPQNENTKVLNLSNGKNIYISVRNWGISNNHDEIVFSETPITVPDKKKDFIFYTDEVFYKLSDSKLDIYACDCDTSEPEINFKDVRVVFNDLSTSRQIEDYSMNYRKYGLERIGYGGNATD